MNDYLICVFPLVGILLVCYASIMYEPISYWTRRKGYPTLGWKFLIMLPLTVGLLGTIAALCVGTNIIVDDGDATHLVLPIFVLVAVCMGGSLLVLKLLPRRKMRITGSRRSMRTPYLLIGSALVIVVGIMVVLSILYRVPFQTVINLIVTTSAIGGSIYYLVSRANTPTVEEGLSQDQRPPMLYLRSFEQEATHFVEVSPAEAAEYSEVVVMNPTYTSHHLTLEQFMAREIQKTIGPLIALGNPTDSLPPEGAYRTYAADGGWQDYFINLSNRSAGILMQMGNSDNLNWELISILGRSLQTKLFIVTPPLLSKAVRYSPTGFFVRLSNRIKGIPPASWDKFAAILEKAGYIPPAEDPGPGAIVTFDEDKRAVILISGAKTPAEYVGAISRHLGNHAEEINPLEAER